MKTHPSPAPPRSLAASANDDTIDTSQLRAILARIAKMLGGIDIDTSPERVTKLTIQMINLTKTIRETETYNRTLLAEERAGAGRDTLDARLEGYVPSQSEAKAIEAELKEHLMRLGPRLFEQSAE